MEKLQKIGKLSTDKILNTVIKMITKKHGTFPAQHLDVGSGTGELIALLRSKLLIQSRAIDYTDKLIRLDNVPMEMVNLNKEKFPYENESFDIVTCTEVIEHLEHYRETIQEAYRVLRSGGTFVVSTPNILNLKSRMRFLIFGFYNLFGPLHFKESDLHNAGGHITPIGLFYLIHALVDADFSDIDVSIDKKQGTSVILLILLYFPIKIFGASIMRNEIKNYKTVDHHNIRFVKMMNTIDIFLGRTIIVGCKKK